MSNARRQRRLSIVETHRGWVDSGSWVSSSTRRGCGRAVVWGAGRGRTARCRHWCSAQWLQERLGRAPAPQASRSDGATAVQRRRAYSWGTAAEAPGGSPVGTSRGSSGPAPPDRGTSEGCSTPSLRSSRSHTTTAVWLVTAGGAGGGACSTNRDTAPTTSTTTTYTLFMSHLSMYQINRQSDNL